MATLTLPSQLSASVARRCLLRPPSVKPIPSRVFAVKTRASSASIAQTALTSMDPVLEEKMVSSNNISLACPICYSPLTRNGVSELSIESASDSTSECNTCKKAYRGKDKHLDLTVSSGSKEYGESMPPSTEIFRTPLVSFLYERGWRQSFFFGGFPGPEKEFEMAKDYLKPVLGGNIVDASCGSGLFSRLFAKSGLFSLVVALDFSENMLRQCYEFVEQEESFPKEKLILVRADISRLPFVSSSVDAVHAGAALHCWPSPSAAVAEISRVLRPGGVFVATTYILDGPLSLLQISRTVRQGMRIGGIYMCEKWGFCDDLCNKTQLSQAQVTLTEFDPTLVGSSIRELE